MQNNYKNTLNYIENIQGVGPVKAKAIFKYLIENKIITKNQNIEENTLRDIIKENIDKLGISNEGVYDLKYNFLKVVPREYIDTIASDLDKIFNKHKINFFIGGSYSRNQETSGDIDLMLAFKTMPNEEDIKKILKLYSFGPLLNSGTTRYSTFICKKFDKKDKDKTVYIKVDIFITLLSDIVFMKTYLIGSGKFNLLMRATAKRQGYTLNQYGLFRNETKITIKSEKELFEILGMDWNKYQDYSARNF